MCLRGVLNETRAHREVSGEGCLLDLCQSRPAHRCRACPFGGSQQARDGLRLCARGEERFAKRRDVIRGSRQRQCGAEEPGAVPGRADQQGCLAAEEQSTQRLHRETATQVGAMRERYAEALEQFQVGLDVRTANGERDQVGRIRDPEPMQITEAPELMTPQSYGVVLWRHSVRDQGWGGRATDEAWQFHGLSMRRGKKKWRERGDRPPR